MVKIHLIPRLSWRNRARLDSSAVLMLYVRPSCSNRTRPYCRKRKARSIGETDPLRPVIQTAKVLLINEQMLLLPLMLVSAIEPLISESALDTRRLPGRPRCFQKFRGANPGFDDVRSVVLNGCLIASEDNTYYAYSWRLVRLLIVMHWDHTAFSVTTGVKQQGNCKVVRVYAPSFRFRPHFSRRIYTKLINN